MAQLATHGRLFDAAGHLRHAWFRPLQAGVIDQGQQHQPGVDCYRSLAGWGQPAAGFEPC